MPLHSQPGTGIGSAGSSGLVRCWRLGGRGLGMALLASLAWLPTLTAGPFHCTFVDKDGKPLRDVEARLRAVDREGGANLPPLFRKSDKEGLVEFPELLPGRYILDAQLRNYVPIKQGVTAGRDVSLLRFLLRRNEFEKIEQRAHRDLDASEFLDAVQGLESLLEFYPEDAALHDTLARAYAGLDDEVRALSEARIAAKLDPERFPAADLRVQKILLSTRGEQALQGFDLVAAQAAFEALKELAPYDSVAYEGLALTYGHQGKVNQAMEAIKKAVELDPDNPELVEIQSVLEGAAGGP